MNGLSLRTEKSKDRIDHNDRTNNINKKKNTILETEIEEENKQ
jgi:hypothetical protein